MRKMKRLFSIILTMIMVFAMTTTVFAADETYDVTINNENAGHTYEAYQIFTGKLSGDILSDIEWGSSVANKTLLAEASTIAAKLDSNYTGDDKLTVDGLLQLVTLGDPIKTVSTQTGEAYVLADLVPGYYLIKDKDGSLNGDNDSYTEYIVKVVKDVTTSPKSDVPEVIKKVKDINDSTETTLSDWQDSADHDLNDAVPFLLKATLANNVEKYDSYKIIFHDTLSAGLTYNEDAKVYFNGNDVTAYFEITEVNGQITVSCKNVKAFGASNSSIITVEYTADLNENAVLGSKGNPNVVYLEYSNNPNWEVVFEKESIDTDGDGEPDKEIDVPKNPGNDGKDNDGDGKVDEDDEKEEPTGNTPEDKVIVFTYKVVVNKVDKDQKALKGAGFTLYKKDKATGEYIAVGSELKGTDMTTFVWTHVDDGEYKIEETTVPSGYNTIDPIEFTITAGHEILSDDPQLTALNSGELYTGEVFTGNPDTGIVDENIVNLKGTVLPETGGIGTTVFYVLGSILVLGAIVVMVTKKIMSER